jgi:RimJ/RimL family protein N-acetyltransferase
LISLYSNPGNPRHGPYVLAIEHRADGALIGHVGFSPLGDEVEVGFSIAQAYQGQGLASEAIGVASRSALQAFGLDRILAVTSVANVASKRAVLRAGFVYTGDEARTFQGTLQRVSMYAISA